MLTNWSVHWLLQPEKRACNSASMCFPWIVLFTPNFPAMVMISYCPDLLSLQKSGSYHGCVLLTKEQTITDTQKPLPYRTFSTPSWYFPKETFPHSLAQTSKSLLSLCHCTKTNPLALWESLYRPKDWPDISSAFLIDWLTQPLNMSFFLLLFFPMPLLLAHHAQTILGTKLRTLHKFLDSFLSL